MRLEDGHFVVGPTSYAICLGHYFTKLVEALKDMYANAPVEPSRLEQPQVLLFVAALCDEHRCPHLFLALRLQLL